MRFFELFIKNKKPNQTRILISGNLSKRGWVDGPRDGSSWSRWTIMDSIIPYLCNSFCCTSSLPSTTSMTDRHRHNGPSRAFVSKHFNSWNMGTGITSLNFMTNLQDGPSQTRRTVTSFVTLHLVRLPHLPSAAALRCHLRTVTSTTDRHKLRRWSLLHFFCPKSPHSSLDRFLAK